MALSAVVGLFLPLRTLPYAGWRGRVRPLRCGFAVESSVDMSLHGAALGMPYASALLNFSQNGASSGQPDERELLADRRWGLLTRRVPEVIERQCHLGEHGDTPSTRPRSRRTGGGTIAVLAERHPANLGGRDGPQGR
jgi:hypothetical protein